ncbi:MAG: DNA-formamidopyrimidine glycosylase [Actinomycetales bacterium]|nr:MAG: DNA-formamidopyrimidine glycosylase [Actinomycetales bacterium]
MPELPEVETVRRGLAQHVVGRRIDDVQFFGSRVTRRHPLGPDDLAARTRHSRVAAARRRGKYLWLVLEPSDDDPSALLVHLGMSGQLLVHEPGSPDPKHVRARWSFEDGGPELRFVDQRTFGGILLSPLGTGAVDRSIPEAISHIAADPFDPDYDLAGVAARFQARDRAIKRGLLDQGIVSGIGNIYADEALWRAQVHGERRSSALSLRTLARVLTHAYDVMTDALAAGGTSFDALYVNVNGSSGYFDRSLAAYGREGLPCRRCGAPIRREHFMNRSSFSCPRCQPRPRTRGRS